MKGDGLGNGRATKELAERNGEAAPGYGLERPALGWSLELCGFWNNPNKNRATKGSGAALGIAGRRSTGWARANGSAWSNGEQ